MKNLFVLLLLCSLCTTPIAAQHRFSVAPTYWFMYNPYSYQADISYGGSQASFEAAGHNLVSSIGLTARYDLTPQWNVSIGALYNSSTDYRKRPQDPYGESSPFTTSGLRLPVLVNYRLTDRRLAPYFSTGATFTNNHTFTNAPIMTEGVVGVGIDYRLGPDLSLLLQPTATYSLTKLASDAYYRTTGYTSYSVGLLTQLIWHF